jgi:pilus assembly protein Flp/PilA
LGFVRVALLESLLRAATGWERSLTAMKHILTFLLDESGATAVEYAVMLALIIGTCIAAISFFGSEAGGSWVDTSAKIGAACN